MNASEGFFGLSLTLDRRGRFTAAAVVGVSVASGAAIPATECLFFPAEWAVPTVGVAVFGDACDDEPTLPACFPPPEEARDEAPPL